MSIARSITIALVAFVLTALAIVGHHWMATGGTLA